MQGICGLVEELLSKDSVPLLWLSNTVVIVSQALKLNSELISKFYILRLIHSKKRQHRL